MGQFVGVFNNIRQRDSRRVNITTESNPPKNRNNKEPATSPTKDATVIDIDSTTKVNLQEHVTENTKKAWTGYRILSEGDKVSTVKKPGILKSKMNTIYNTTTSSHNNSIIRNERHSVQISDDIEQLITMMKNHKVTDDVPTTTNKTGTTSFDFNFNKLLTPQNSPPNITMNTLPEFKFSFPATKTDTTIKQTIPAAIATTATTTTTTTTLNDTNNLDIPSEELTKQKSYQDRLSNRKILPLPKPRLPKSDNNNNIPLPSIPLPSLPLPQQPTVFRTSTTSTTDRDSNNNNNKKKLKCVEEKDKEDKPILIDNKRKERNWVDTSRGNSGSSGITNANTKAVFVESPQPQSVLSIPVVAKVSISTTTTTTSTAKKATTDKKPTITKKNDTSAATLKKKKNKNKQKNEDIAPGGFLSSDVTLFDSPIPDDWICLFCQYDILFSSYKEAKKKNRRKKSNTRSKKSLEEEIISS